MFSLNQLNMKTTKKWGAFLGSPRAKQYIVRFAQANVDGSLNQGELFL